MSYDDCSHYTRILYSLQFEYLHLIKKENKNKKQKTDTRFQNTLYRVLFS